MNTIIQEVVKDQNLILLTDNVNVFNALNELSDARVNSAPVFNPQNETCYGLVDTLDLVFFLFSLMEKEGLNLSQLQDPTVLNVLSEKFNSASICDAIDLSHKNKLLKVDLLSTIKDAINLFLSNDVRRIAVVTADKSKSQYNGISHLLTQSTTIDYLSRYVTTELASKTVTELGLDHFQVFTISHKASALEGFKKLRDESLTAIGVVDDDGKIIACLSSSDLKGLCGKGFKELLLPISEYLTSIHVSEGKPKEFIITVLPQSTFKDLIEKLVKDYVHRLFVVDNSGKPISVIDIKDLLNVMLSH